MFYRVMVFNLLGYSTSSVSMNILDESQLKAEMRQMYREVGPLGSIQCLYEILISATLLLEVIDEERAKEKGLE